MKIKEIKVIVCCPARNFVTVKIETDKGVTGLGDATLNGREMAVVAYLTEHIIPCLIGKDPQQIEHIWQYLYKGAYWRKGPVTMAAIAAIDMALWDIKGKMADMPVYQLLGGKSRNKIKVYAHANGETEEEVLTHLGNLIEAGFKAVRLQCAVPGLTGSYGTLGNKKDYFEMQGDRPLPPEHPWDTGKYLNFIPQLFKKAREKFGFEVDLLHDVHSRLTPIEAARLGKELEPYKLMFMEDASPAENPDAYRIMREHTTTPLAVGENFSVLWDAKTLIENHWIDYIRMSATHGGGISALRKVADFADIHRIRTAPHGAPDLSPVCHAAQAHVNIYAPNFGVQEFIGFGTKTLNDIFSHPLSLKDGYVFLEDKAGLGVEINEEAAKEYPYKRSYLPVSVLEDGTVWDW